MKRAALILAALAAILTAAAAPVRTATENFVTNKIAEAVAAIPAPGDYETVSNKAMNSVQSSKGIMTGDLTFTGGQNGANAKLHSDNGTLSIIGTDPGGSINAYSFNPSAIDAVAKKSDIPDLSGFATTEYADSAAASAASAAMNDSISTNNAAFVSAVLAVPLAGADASDLAELSEYGSYGTVGAAILALIAGLAALKRRVTSAETALVQKASLSDLPYAIVTPGEWEFSDGGTHDISGPYGFNGMWYYTTDVYQSNVFSSESEAVTALTLTFTDPSGESDNFTATRPSLPGHLCDRAVNAVSVAGDTTLTLPALVNAGKARDFLVRLEISGSTVPTITFAAPTGETITYETDGDEFPVPDEAGTWLYSFTETDTSTFAVSLKKVNVVAQGGGT